MAVTSTSVTLVIAKLGTYRYLGHRDIARAIARVLRRSRLPLRFTAGFHPIPKMILPEPLPVGVESEAERWVIFFEEPVDPTRLREALDPLMPEGLPIVDILDGDQREALDSPIRLLLESEYGPRVEEAVRTVPNSDCGIGQLFLQRTAEGVVVDLRPVSGRRPSVGKWLKQVVSLLGPGPVAIRRVLRLRSSQ